MEVPQFTQEIKVSRNGFFPFSGLHEEVNHLPASAFVAGRQIITNAHDGHVFVDKVGEVEIRLQGGCTVDGETGNQHRDQNDADLLLLLHPDDLFRQRRET